MLIAVRVITYCNFELTKANHRVNNHRRSVAISSDDREISPLYDCAGRRRILMVVATEPSRDNACFRHVEPRASNQWSYGILM